jgi:hypothetical protein
MTWRRRDRACRVRDRLEQRVVGVHKGVDSFDLELARDLVQVVAKLRQLVEVMARAVQLLVQS